MARRKRKRKKTNTSSESPGQEDLKDDGIDEDEEESGSEEEGLLSEEDLEEIEEEAGDEMEIEIESSDNEDEAEDDSPEEDLNDDDRAEQEDESDDIDSDGEDEEADITIEKLEKLDKGMKVIEIDIARPEEETKESETKQEPAKSVVEPHILKVVSRDEQAPEDNPQDETVSQVSIGQAGSLAGQLEAIEYLFLRVNEKAIKKLFESAQFQGLFENSDLRDTVIMHINLRRSADLMLHARNPLLYLDFMMKLESNLREIIIENYGVFERFTGDGLIAFFPDFYSGKEAMCFAVKAAGECQAFFKAHYATYRNSFTTVVLEAGLCIGIDFGKANIIKVNEELMSVGEPVVNARKMSSGNAGETILNQAAFDELRRRHKGDMKHVETEIEYAGKGRVLGHMVEIDWETVTMKDPDWDVLIKQTLS